MPITPFELDTAHGPRLHGLLHTPGAAGPHPTIVLCHGFKGFMEWGFYPPLVELLVERGFAVVRFNFSGSGMRPGDELVTDTEAFRTATFSKDVTDLEAILAAAGATIGNGAIDRSRLGLLGHSRGGGTAILAAAKRPDVKALVTWAAVSTFDRLDPAAVEHWRAQGALPIENARTGQSLAMGVEVLDDLEAHRGDLDILAAAGRVAAPWLIVHGGEDETVPAGEGAALAERARSAEGSVPELLLIDGAGHTFGAVHPFAGPTAELVQLFNGTQRWFRRHL